MSPLGYWITGLSDRYAIDLRLPVTAGRQARPWKAGDRVVSLRRDVPRVPVSAAERRQQEARLYSYIASFPTGTPVGPRAVVPATKPAWTDIVVGADGRIWVQVAMPSVPFNRDASEWDALKNIPQVNWREPVVFDVFDPVGVLVGRVAMPTDTRLVAARGDNILGVYTDADGVETVRKYRVIWR
jgi:hypothetical protein